jgi:hypothetical protein
VNPTIRVVGGGQPSDEQLAALTIAIETLVAEDEALATAAAVPEGWMVAALREGVGGPLVAEPPGAVSSRRGGSPPDG